MKPKQAIKHLEFIVDNQQTVSTSRLKELVEVVSAHRKMLESDNRKLRNRIKNQRKKIKELGQ